MILTMKACLMIWININIQPFDMQIINYKFHLNLYWIYLYLWAISGHFNLEIAIFLDTPALSIELFYSQVIYANCSKFEYNNDTGPRLKLKIEHFYNFFKHFTGLHSFLRKFHGKNKYFFINNPYIQLYFFLSFFLCLQRKYVFSMACKRFFKQVLLIFRYYYVEI